MGDPLWTASVAVGDYDPAALESWIRQAFADLQGPEEARPRPLVPVTAMVRCWAT